MSIEEAKEVATTLRSVADEIESGEVIVDYAFLNRGENEDSLYRGNVNVYFFRALLERN
jgi:hypothetical protein